MRQTGEKRKVEGWAERREEQDPTAQRMSKVRLPQLLSEIRARRAGQPWSQWEKQTAELLPVVFAGLACFGVDLSLRTCSERAGHHFTDFQRLELSRIGWFQKHVS